MMPSFTDEGARFPERVGEWLLDLLGFIGLGLGGSQAAAQGWLDTLRRDSLYEHGDVPLDLGMLAESVVKGAVGHDWATDEAKKHGVTANNFDVAVHTTGNPPGPGELLDMLRRGIIDDDRFTLGIRQGYTKVEWIEQLRGFRWLPLPLGEVVAGLVQNHTDLAHARDVARQHGVTEPDLALMVDNHGNPPGPMQLLELWRRGDITEEEVDQGLRESRLKNKWIPGLKLLMVRKIPQRTIAMLVGHGAMTDDTARAKLRALGYSEEDAGFIVAAAHRTVNVAHKELSVTQITGLYAERALPRDAALADLVTLGYSDTSAAQLLQLVDSRQAAQVNRSAVTKIHTLYVAHRIGHTEAVVALDELHVDPAHRDELLAMWDIEATANTRDLTEAQIVAAGRANLFDPSEVLARLTAMGYSDTDAFVLAVLGKVIPNPNIRPQGG